MILSVALWPLCASSIVPFLVFYIGVLVNVRKDCVPLISTHFLRCSSKLRTLRKKNLYMPECKWEYFKVLFSLWKNEKKGRKNKYFCLRTRSVVHIEPTGAPVSTKKFRCLKKFKKRLLFNITLSLNSYCFARL